MLPAEARKRIARLRRRCNLAVLLRVLLVAATAYLALAGAAVLACRLFWPAARHHLWLLAPAGAAPLGVAFGLFRRRRYRDAEIEGIADRLAGLGGLLLTLSTRDDSVWEEKLSHALAAKRLGLPRLRLGQLLRVLPYAAFLAVALAIPQRMLPLRPRALSSLEYEQLKKLESQIELLKQDSLLPPEEVKELQEQVERMLNEPGDSPQGRWEALDALREKLSSEMAGVDQAMKQADRAAQGGKEEIEKTLRDLAKKGLLQNLPPELAEKIGKDGQELAKGGGLPGDPATLKAARECLKKLAAGARQQLARAGIRPSGKDEGGLDDFQMARELEKSFEISEKPGGA